MKHTIKRNLKVKELILTDQCLKITFEDSVHNVCVFDKWRISKILSTAVKEGVSSIQGFVEVDVELTEPFYRTQAVCKTKQDENGKTLFLRGLDPYTVLREKGVL